MHQSLTNWAISSFLLVRLLESELDSEEALDEQQAPQKMHRSEWNDLDSGINHSRTCIFTGWVRVARGFVWCDLAIRAGFYARGTGQFRASFVFLSCGRII